MSVLDKIRGALCHRKLEAGDVVLVPKLPSGADPTEWEEWEHPIGGAGHWALYVGGKFNVRPLYPDNTTGPLEHVERVQHLDDVIQDVAVKTYYETKGRKRRRK